MVNFLMILGSLALAGGGIGYFTFPMGLEMGVKMAINLKEDGMVFPMYIDPPFPTRSAYYMYAIQNPREVLRGSKMQLQVKGPYYYNTYLVRDNISFNKKGERLKYDSHRKLYLDEEKSANLDEKMWLLNPILPGALVQIKSLVLDRLPFKRFSEPIVFNSVNVILDNFKERLILRTTPRTLLQGRKVELLESITGLAGRFGLGSLVPPGPPENTFGLAFVQNETVDPMEIWTGVGSSVHKFAEVSKWKDKSKLSIWRSQKCNEVNGTNGELYKPFLEEGKPIKIFLAPLCRSFYVVPVGDEMVTFDTGLKALEYEITPSLFQGVRSKPNNRCYCTDTRTYDCQYDGLMSMGPCFFDSPLYFSRPNFKGVERKLRETIEDNVMFNSSVPDKQSFYVEPITGTVLRANVSFLAIFKVVRQPYMRDLAKVQNLTYAPVFVANEQAVVPFDVVWQIYGVQKMVEYYKPAMIGTALSGAGMLLLNFIF